MEYTQNAKVSIEQRVAFLEKKNEALLVENNFLKEQNSKFSNEIELLNRINDNLKEKITQYNAMGIDQKMRRRSTMRLRLSVDTNDIISDINAGTENSKAETTIQSKSSTYPSILPPVTQASEEHTQLDISDNARDQTKLDISDINLKDLRSPIDETPELQQMEAKDKSTKEAGTNNVAGLERLLASISENPDWFYTANNLIKLPPYSPFSKTKVSQIEKHLDETETLVKKWTKSLKLQNTSCLAYIKTIESFAGQILLDAKFFDHNKELQHLIVLIAQFLRENAIYLEVFTNVINNSICNPLKMFYKNILPAYKDSRKKVQKALEEMELAESKYLGLKKSAILKDPLNGQYAFKNYMNAFRNFELGRIDHVRILNDVNMNFNLEFVDKLCSIFTSKMAYFNSAYDMMVGLEGQIQVFNNGAFKKGEIYGELNEEYKKLRTEVERSIYIKYPVSLVPNAVKESYLYVKYETKDFRKRYCVMQENGLLCYIREQEVLTDEPQLKELADIKLCKVKETNEYDHMFCFELVSVAVKKPIILQADSEVLMNEWISAIQTHTETVLFKSPHIEMNAAPAKKNLLSDILNPLTQKLSNQEKPNSIKATSSANSNANAAANSPTNKAKQALIAKILESNLCSDCGASAPSWVSLNLGTIICIECSGVHRRLGPSISKVRSLKLDNLSLPILELFSKLNTKDINRVWEGATEETPSMKPNPESDQDKREAWIKNKYVEKVFVRPIEGGDWIKLMCKALKEKDIIQVLNVLACIKEDLNGIYLIDGKKQGILHYACANSSKDAVELLIRNGCTLDLDDQDHCKPLDHSMFGNNVEVMEYLVTKLDEMER